LSALMTAVLNDRDIHNVSHRIGCYSSDTSITYNVYQT